MDQGKLVAVEDLTDVLSEYDDVFCAFKIEWSDEYGINKVTEDENGNLCLSDDGNDDCYSVDGLIELLEEYDDDKLVYVKLDDEIYYIDLDDVCFDDDTDDEDEYEVVVTVYNESTRDE